MNQQGIKAGRERANVAVAIESDKPIVTQCQADSRSASAASILQAAGFKVTNMTGGLGAWSDLDARACVATVIGELTQRIEELERQLGMNSGNSSQSPSAVAPGKKPQKPKPRPSVRKRGGQPGHPKRTRPLNPPERPGSPAGRAWPVRNAWTADLDVGWFMRSCVCCWLRNCEVDRSRRQQQRFGI